MADKPVQFFIEDGPTFFTDEISIATNAQRFFFDFKNTSPRIDPRSTDMIPVALKHSVMVMDPQLAKVFSQLLNDHVAKYEAQHGAIPDAPQQPAPPTVSSSSDHPDYFG
jgi:hypothetical protein